MYDPIDFINWKNMHKQQRWTRNTLKVNKSKEGESIEQKVSRITNNKEPIKDGAPMIYTNRKEGVKPGYDVRTDRFEVAIDAMDKVSKAHLAKREERHNPKLTEDQQVIETKPDGSQQAATDNP